MARSRRAPFPPRRPDNHVYAATRNEAASAFFEEAAHAHQTNGINALVWFLCSAYASENWHIDRTEDRRPGRQVSDSLIDWQDQQESRRLVEIPGNSGTKLRLPVG
jgi:hypothetical protein